MRNTAASDRVQFTWTAWNSGVATANPVGYGLKVPIGDRDRYFDRAWKSVVVELPLGEGFEAHEFNVAKPSFWNSTCHELIGRPIGEWLVRNGLAPWPRGQRPRVEVEVISPGRFRVHSPRPETAGR